jgi:hypothetical protein
MFDRKGCIVHVPVCSYICRFFHEIPISLRLSWDRCYDFKNIFAEKFGKKLALLTQNTAKLCKILITLVFEKKRQFFAENCQKSQKIVIITSTPALTFLWHNLCTHLSLKTLLIG